MLKNRIKIVVTFHNIRNYIEECLNSILKQKYDNWICVLVDNCSTDGTYDLLPQNDPRFKIIRNNTRNSPLWDDHNGIIFESNEEDIVLILCGDDMLIGDYALDVINKIYVDNPNVLLTHGQYIDSNGNLGNQSAYYPFRYDNIRRLGMCCNNNCLHCSFPYNEYLGKGGFDFGCSHIKTFKYKIYKELIRQDPNLYCYKEADSTTKISNSADVYYMTPLMEIAGLENIYYNPIPLYWYRLHDNNEHTLNLNVNQQPLINIKPRFYKYGTRPKKIICCDGGLGDNLSLSTLPEEYDKLGFDVYISGHNIYRNDEIYKLVWGTNPYIKGISYDRSNLGHVLSPTFNGNDFIETIESTNGIYESNNKYPKIYTNLVKIDSFKGKVVLLLESITAKYDTFEVQSSLIELLNTLNISINNTITLVISNDVNMNKNSFMDNKEVNSFVLSKNTYVVNDIFELVNIIHSCDKFITLHSGSASLASAVDYIDNRKDRTYVLMNDNLQSVYDKKIFIYDNQSYYFKK